MFRSLLFGFRSFSTFATLPGFVVEDEDNIPSRFEFKPVVPKSVKSSIIDRHINHGYLFYIISFVCLFSLFIPLITQAVIDETQFDESLRHPVTQLVTLGCILFNAPVLIDSFIEIIYSKQFSCMTFIRLISGISLILTSAIFLSTTRYSNCQAIYETLSAAHIYIEVIIFCWLLQYLDKHRYWTKTKAVLILFVFFGVHYLLLMGKSFYSNILMIIPTMYATSIYYFWCKASRNSIFGIPSSDTSFNDYYIIITSRAFILACLAYMILGFLKILPSQPIYLIIIRSLFSYIMAYLPGRMQINITAELNAFVEANKLKDVLETKRNFVRYVSHEIRTPLNTATLGIDLIESKLRQIEGIPDHIYDDLAMVKFSCQTAVSILNDLLAYEKLESGIMSLEKSMCKVSPFLKKTLLPFRLFAEQHEVTMDISYLVPEAKLKHYSLHVDESKISQVLRNLASNAIKFSKMGGNVKVLVKLMEASMELELPRLRLEFIDSGVGISEENMGRLFGNGVQFDAAKNQNGGGSGMGLWISKNIIEMHDGSIGCISEGIGKGCTFFIEINLDSKESTASNPHDFEEVISTKRDVMLLKEGLHFLVVDDSTPTRKMVCNVIKYLRCESTQAVDGVEAISKVKERMTSAFSSFDIILMDYQMPNLNGPAACEIIRKLGFSGIIIGVTGMAHPEEQDIFLKSGANCVLVKPMSKEMLVSTVHKLLIGI